MWHAGGGHCGVASMLCLCSHVQCVWSSSAQRHSLVTGRLHEALRSRSTSRQRQNTGLTDIVIIITHQIILQTQMALTSPFPHFSLPFSLIFSSPAFSQTPFLSPLFSFPLLSCPFFLPFPLLPTSLHFLSTHTPLLLSLSVFPLAYLRNFTSKFCEI